MKTHKIALLVSSWDDEILEEVIKGAQKRLDEIGWDLHVFITHPTMRIEDPDNFGNYNIFSLANYAEYDGFLLSANVVGGYDMLKKYYSNILEGDKPVVALDQIMENISSLYQDGYSAMFQLVEHLIVEHGCRNLIYVGGVTDHPDNVVRKKAFIDALKKHNIPVEDSHIRDYWFMAESGRQAYLDFKEIGLNCPDAVVCANDAMALGYCQEAEQDGFYCPTDFLITGYDNDDKSKSFFPKITSVEKNAENIGYDGCNMLLEQIFDHKSVEHVTFVPELVLRGSCGCYSKEESENLSIQQVHQRMYSMKKELTEYYGTVTSIRQSLALATDENLFKYYLADIMKQFEIGGYSMCINQDVYFDTAAPEFDWNIGYCEKQYVMTGMRGTESQEEACVINVADLYPSYLDFDDNRSHVYLFLPIQKAGVCYGYFVVVDGSTFLLKQWALHVSGAIDNAYANLRNLLNLEKLNKWLDNAYIVDAMTGLYNRFGYMRQGYEMYEKCKVQGKPLIVMFMDMDRLKYINDHFGHSAGDEALVAYSALLKRCAGEDMLAIRYGGDEFLLIGPMENLKAAEEFKKLIYSETERLNEERNAGYELGCSIGYILTDPKSEKDLDDYVKEADSIMYADKQKRKKSRTE